MAYKHKIPCIYQIRRIETGDCYVGSTSNRNERWGAHRRDLNKGKHHAPRMQNAWTKHGSEAFEFVMLEVCDGIGHDLKQVLKVREDHWIETLRPTYNVLAAAYSALGFKQPRESVERRAALQRGVKRPAELVERIAAKHRGKIMPREAVERTAAANRGRKHTAESIAKMRAALLGRKKSPEHVEAMRKARLGFTHTDEAKEKNRLASTGRVKPESARAKMREYWRLRRERTLEPEVFADGV